MSMTNRIESFFFNRFLFSSFFSSFYLNTCQNCTGHHIRAVFSHANIPILKKASCFFFLQKIWKTIEIPICCTLPFSHVIIVKVRLRYHYIRHHNWATFCHSETLVLKVWFEFSGKRGVRSNFSLLLSFVNIVNQQFRYHCTGLYSAFLTSFFKSSFWFFSGNLE